MLGLAAATVALSLAPGLRAPDLPMPPVQAMFGEAPAPVSAQGWMVWSVDDDAELASFNPDVRRAPASVTKVMTALLVVEKGDLDTSTVISETADSTPIGYVGQADVKAGEEWSVFELLQFLLVKSGNDVAAALAEHVAGTEAAFVVMMNEKAAELGMTQTTFMNPHGLDEAGHLTTPRDLITLGMAAIREPLIIDTARIVHLTFYPPGRDPLEIDTTDGLIGVFPGVYGLKTGDTAAAGLVLLSYMDTGRGRFLTIVMGSQDRDYDAAQLLAYALQTGGPADYLLAPIAGTDLALQLPEWMQARIAATGRLADGNEAPPDPLDTPVVQRVIAAMRDLLPAILGGAP